MEILLLGTGAAEGIPALFNDSRVTQIARAKGGKEVRSRSAALIDSHLKIDLGPDTWSQAARFGCDTQEWANILITHSHDDHLCLSELQYWLYPFNENEFAPPTLHGPPKVCELIHERYPDWPFEVNVLLPGEGATLGDTRVEAVEAHHISDQISLNYIVEHQGRRALYATDTGWWPSHTWEALNGARLDCLIIEATNGRVVSDYEGHLRLTQVYDLVEKLHKSGGLKADAQVVTTHHSHLGDMTHEELVQELEPRGIQPGYDGMRIQV